jgi:hypothetical protein
MNAIAFTLRCESLRASKDVPHTSFVFVAASFEARLKEARTLGMTPVRRPAGPALRDLRLLTFTCAPINRLIIRMMNMIS